MIQDNANRLSGQSAIVTGAGRGIGRILALTLADEGARVVVSGRNVKNLEGVAGEIRISKAEAVVIPCDVTRRDQVETLVDKTQEAFGTVDLLVNNAGVAGSIGLLVDVEEAEWDAIMETNAKGVFLMTQAVLPTMMKKKSGHIVTISSSGGTPKSRNSGTIPYSMSKWAVEGMRHTLAMQLEPYGIRVNNLSPGLTLNDLQKGRSTVERILSLRESVRWNEWVAESFRYLVCETGGLTGVHIAAPEWDAENGIERELITETEIRAFLEN